ncbi:MAG: hypothetical protein DI537_39765 [Stutzerimonas stutzeri]|nr:MAG: hypothetical protein DI537_39765 [Stutzerimonas stutzeri]
MSAIRTSSKSRRCRTSRSRTMPGRSVRRTSYPRWKHVQLLAIQSGGLAITGRWRHTSPMRDSSVVTNPASSTAGAPGYDYFDLSASLRVSDRFELRGGVNNLTDKAPPIIGGTAGVTNNGVYYVVGRTLFLAFKARL